MGQQSVDVDARLEVFVPHYVSTIEAYFSAKYEQITNNTPKPGKYPKFLENLLGLGKHSGEILEGPIKACVLIAMDLLSTAANTAGAKYNRKQLMKLAQNRYDFMKDPQSKRPELVKQACIIFKHFEAQMMNISSKFGWERAVQKAAQDAVSRVVNYLKEHPENEIDATTAGKGIILGESKTYLGLCRMPKSQRGHGLNMDNKDIRTTDLYGKLGMKDDGKYYTLNETNWPQTGTWFRLRFEWESEEGYELTSPANEYAYTMTTEIMERKQEYLLSEIEGSTNVTNVDEMLDEIRQQAAQDVEEIIQRLEDLKDTSNIVKTIATELLETSIRHVNISSMTYEAVMKILDHLNIDHPQAREDTEPIKFMAKMPDERFTGRERQLQELDDKVRRQTEKRTISSQTSVISGLGGIGKTQLARRYAQKFCQNWDVLWLDASSSLDKSFVQLANDCDIRVKGDGGEPKNIATIVQEVYKHFSVRAETFECLFVFDNAETPDDLKDYMPNFDGALLKTKNALRILITTRYGEWPRVAVLRLTVFDLKEAINLVKDGLQIKDQDQNKSIEDLVKTLQRFPLALGQAVAYISNDEEYTVTDYLNEYRVNAKNLLESEIFRNDLGIEYKNTTYTAWDMTVQKISKNDTCGKQAESIMKIIAFLSPDDIDTELFHHLYPKDEVQKAVSLIVKYSMATGEQKKNVITVMSVHRVVQEVGRQKMEQKGEYNDIVDKVVDMLIEGQKKLNCTQPQREITARLKRLQPHLDVMLHLDELKKDTLKDARHLQRKRDVLETLVANNKFITTHLIIVLYQQIGDLIRIVQQLAPQWTLTGICGYYFQKFEELRKIDENSGMRIDEAGHNVEMRPLVNETIKVYGEWLYESMKLHSYERDLKGLEDLQKTLGIHTKITTMRDERLQKVIDSVNEKLATGSGGNFYFQMISLSKIIQLLIQECRNE